MREFEVAIDEAFIKGLRPERRMRRGTPVLTECLGFRIGKYSIEGSEYFIDPIPATVDMFYNWPFPQLIKGERYRFLIVRDHINMEDVVYSISADYTTATEIFAIDELTFGQGTLMEAADFGEYAFMTNGVIMIYWDTTITDWNEIVASATIPMMRTVCNFKGQMIGGCVLSDWHDCDETFVTWSKIGQADFTPGRRNEAGYRRDPFGGEIYHVRRLGAYVVVYSSKGITKMIPVSSPAATFGFEELHDVGLANRGAVAGNLKEHLFVDVDHYVWKLNEGGLTKLGYQEFVDDLSYGDILVHHDINKKDFYISAASAPLTTLPPTTVAPSTTAAPTTLPTTSAPTTAAPTTLAPTTLATTAVPTTTATSAAPTTLATTTPPTTAAPTTAAPTTPAPTTLATSAAPTTLPTTSAPTTLATTAPPTTSPPTTTPPTTTPPTTAAPTTAAPTTLTPTTDPSFGETYYFSQSGNDSTGDGSHATPWKTIQKAEAEMDNGDKLLFLCGDTWTLQTDPGGIFTIAHLNVTVGAYYGAGVEGISGNRPIFTGTVVNWGQADGYPTSTTTPLVNITAANVTFENIEVKDNPMSYGIRTSYTTATTIRNCLIHETWRNAILIWYAPDSIAENNEIYGGSRKYPVEGGPSNILFQAPGGIARYNHIYNTYGEGIVFGAGSGGLAEYNIIGPTTSVGIYAPANYDHIIRYNLVYGTNDMTYEGQIAGWTSRGIEIGPEFGGGSMYNVKVYGNIVINRSYGIRLKCTFGETVETFYIYNNIIVDCKYNFKVDNVDRISNCYFKNNLSYFETGGDITAHAHLTGGTTGVECDYNVWSGGQPSDAMFQGAHDQIGAPNLTRTTWRQLPITALSDFTTIDAYITAGSSAIDTGMLPGAEYNDIFGPATDFHTTPTDPTIELLPNSDYGAGPDIGAFVRTA